MGTLLTTSRVLLLVSLNVSALLEHGAIMTCMSALGVADLSMGVRQWFGGV